MLCHHHQFPKSGFLHMVIPQSWPPMLYDNAIMRWLLEQAA